MRLRCDKLTPLSQNATSLRCFFSLSKVAWFVNF